MIRKFILTTVFATLPIIAVASDILTKASPKKAASIANIHDWTGIYAGLVTGFDYRSSDFSVSNLGYTVSPFFSPNGSIPQSKSTTGQNLIGGLRAGANYQFNYFVLGIEGNWNEIHSKRSYSGSGSIVGTPIQTLDFSTNSKLSWLSTTRGRAGIAIDNFLIYGTGGLAFGSMKSVTTATYSLDAAPTASYNGSKSGVQKGWAAGGGVEYAVNKNASVSAEYLYYDLGNVNYLATQSSPADATQNATMKVKTDGYLFQLGFNYHF